MKKLSDPISDNWQSWREGIIGFGEQSSRKSYYPELQRKMAELERFKALLDESHDAIILVDAISGQIRDVNKTAYSLLACNREILLTLTLYDIVNNQIAQQLQQLSQQVTSCFDCQQTITTTLCTVQKTEIPVEISIRLVEFDKILYIVAVAKDITERLRAQALNERLHQENMRMSAELEVTRRLQQMILPKKHELQQISGLDIAGFMEPAAEIGGDYYDILQQDGRVKISIGDVTGHGLESGVLMLMVQTAVRTLLANHVTDTITFLNVLNQTIYNNIRRMNCDKSLTLSLLDYQDGQLHLSGQHEEILLVRAGGQVERIDTTNLGFIVGIEPDISAFIAETEVQLQPEDGIVLYTDGITEARNGHKEQYGIERLCQMISQHWHNCATAIQQAVIADLRQHMGIQPFCDDVTLLIIKRKQTV